MDLISITYLDSPPVSPACKSGEGSVSVANKRKAGDNSIQDLLFDLADFGDDSEDESGSTSSSVDLTKRRVRLSLLERKFHVERYLWYKQNNQAFCQIEIGDQLMRSFVNDSNATGIYYRLNKSSLSRWIHAYKRGEYDMWGGHKLGHSKVTDKWIVVQRIDRHLKARDPFHAAFNKVDWSPSLPDQYGVVARKFTPSGTFLGFYKGAVLSDEKRDSRNYDYTFAIGRNLFIDASNLVSCFARYYNCATNHADQNVAVELLSNWTNPQKAICFIANRNIAEGEEFLVSYGPDYWAHMVKYLPRKSQLKKVCEKLSDKRGYSLFTPRYSVEAPTLAANFQDDQSDSDDDDSEDSSDSDFTC
jgi:hypothetical protein